MPFTIGSRAIERILGGAAALAALGAASPAGACTVSVTSVAFGNYDTLSPIPTDSAGAFSAVCHPSDQSLQVSISGGSGGSPFARTMVNGGVTLDYNLYADAARTIVWGDGMSAAGVTVTNGTVSSGRRTFNRPIYGRIPALQAVGAGAYNDSLIVTVVF